MKELARGGQVYIVYNIVKTMDIFAESLSKLVPEARIAYAHGQMSERRLENTMMDFRCTKVNCPTGIRQRWGRNGTCLVN